MEHITYYPGCGLKKGAEGYEISLINVLNYLGIDAVELEGWNCCGAVYPLSDDRLMNLVGPLRSIIKARDQGVDTLYVACSMCYGVLSRAENFARTDQDMERINQFIDNHNDYFGGVEIKHISELLLAQIDKQKLLDITVERGPVLAPYYGCTLLRPKGNSVPKGIFEQLLRDLGYKVIEFPEQDRCCGSFHSVNRKDIVTDRATQIIDSAQKFGADALVVSCPLCEYNLVASPKHVIPIIWLTQAVGLALGVEKLGLDCNRSNQKLLHQFGNTIVKASSKASLIDE